MAEKNTCDVAVFSVHPTSRLPRPTLVRKRKRNSPVCQRGSQSNPPSGTIQVKFPALNSSSSSQPRVRRLSEENSLLPLRCQAVPHSESFSRPQTSSLAHAKRKPSGRSNLLHKIKTISIRTNSDEDDQRFTRFHPLPAIGGQSSEDERLDTADSCTLSVCPAYESELERTPSPTFSDTSAISMANNCDSQIWDEESDPNLDTETLFERVDREAPQIFNNLDNGMIERPKTSHPLTTVPSTEQFVERPLVRSNTYDILPTVNEEESPELEDLASDENHCSPMEADILNSTPVSAEGSHHSILLAMHVQTFPDEYIYGYFQCDSNLQSILNFASEMHGCSYEGFRLMTGDAEKQVLTDLSQTITQAKLKHRTLLHIIKDDNG